MLQIWFKIFFRNQKKNWLNTLINISGLTLGLAGLLIVLLYINEEKSYNQWNPNKDDVYRVNLNRPTSEEVWFTVNAGMYLTYPKELPEVTEALMVNPFYRSKVVQYKDGFEFNNKTISTEPQFFDFFPFEILEGSTQKFAETRKNIALSKDYANRIFKGEKVVGNTVKIDDESYIVACVYKIPKNSHQEPDLLMQYSEDFEVHWGNHNNELFCKITEGTDLEALKQKMDAIIINKAYKSENISERHRHRFEFNNEYLPQIEEAGLKATGINQKTGLVEVVELENHPWFVGVQYHPEYKSTVLKPHPLFVDFIKAALKQSKK